MKPWAWLLLILIIADSIFTVFIGEELNPIILWFMNTFNLSLALAMILRVFLLSPFVYILNKFNYSKLTFMLYFGVYILLTGVQFV